MEHIGPNIETLCFCKPPRLVDFPLMQCSICNEAIGPGQTYYTGMIDTDAAARLLDTDQAETRADVGATARRDVAADVLRGVREGLGLP